MAAPSATTKLNAVNVLLNVIGEAPVSTLTNSTNPNVIRAEQILDEVDRQVQSQGWYFNREYGVTLTPDANTKEIKPGVAVARCDAEYRGRKVVLRGPRLYDLDNRTYQFDREVTCEVVYWLDYDELPESARQYIMVSAARKLILRADPNAINYRFTREDEVEAKARFMEENEETADRTFLQGTGVARVFRNRTGRRY